MIVPYQPTASSRVFFYRCLPIVAGQKIKNAEGNPSALGGPSIRRIQIIYIMNRSVLHLLLAELFQEVLLELSSCAKEGDIGCGFFMPVVFDGGKLYPAYKVCNLGQAVIARTCVAIPHCLYAESIPEALMERPGYHLLTVVVVELNCIVALKPGELFEEKQNDLFTKAGTKGFFILKLAFSVHKGFVAKRDVPCKGGEAKQKRCSLFDIEAPVVFIASHERGQVKWNIGQFGLFQSIVISHDLLAKTIGLIVEHERYDVVSRIFSEVTGFIDEYRKLAHRSFLPRIQECRGDPPALDSPPWVESRLFYTMNRSDDSIISKHEHMFTIHDANMCSTWDVQPAETLRKAA